MVKHQVTAPRGCAHAYCETVSGNSGPELPWLVSEEACVTTRIGTGGSVHGFVTAGEPDAAQVTGENPGGSEWVKLGQLLICTSRRALHSAAVVREAC